MKIEVKTPIAYQLVYLWEGEYKYEPSPFEAFSLEEADALAKMWLVDNGKEEVIARGEYGLDW